MKKICYVLTIPLTVRAFFIPQLKYLAENGFDVTVVCSSDENLQNELGETVKFVPLDMPRGISILGSFKVISKLKKFFKEEKFDIVQYSTPNAGLYSSFAAKSAGVKIRNYHLMGFRFLGASGLGRKILKTLEIIACKNSTSIECVSESNLNLGIQEKVFHKEKALVVGKGSTGGVDISRFNIKSRDIWRTEIRKEIGISCEDFVYGFVGRITRDKGVNEILEAYFNLKTDAKLLLVGAMEGEDTLDPQLLDKAKKSDNVIFHESVSDIERYYAAIDVLLLPSYREGFGNVIIEAAAVGTPAIVSNIPGPVDTVVKDETALIVEPKCAEQLSVAMADIRTIDYKQMGLNAYDFIKENFDSNKLNVLILNQKNKYLIH